MSSDILVLLVTLTVAIILMMSEVLRADLVALLLAVTLALIGTITPQEAFSGLSRSAVVTVLAVFILTNGLYRTGVTRRVGVALHRLAGGRPTILLLLTMLWGATLSLFMHNIAAAAVLMPALMDVARRTRTSPSKLLMPLAYSVNLGGMATLLATSNILVSTTLQDLGLAPYGVLDFLPVGVPLIIVGVLYMLLIGHRLLPAISPAERLGRIHRLQKELSKTYALEERLREVHVPSKSPLIGKSIEASQVGEKLGLSILAIWRNGQPAILAPGGDCVLKANDALLVAGRDERVQQLTTDMGAQVLETSDWNNLLSTDRIVLLEVILAPRSNAAGHTLKELRFREKYGLSVVALWRGGRPYRTDVGDMQLLFGDALLIHGPREGISILRTDPDFLVLAEPEDAPRIRKGWLATAIMALTLIAAAFNLLPTAVAMMLGALGMIVTGCLTMDEAYRGIEWQAIFLIAGMLPVGVALSRSGAAEWLSQLLVSLLAGWGPLAVASGLLLLTTLLAQVMSGQVAAVVLTPIAVAAADQIGANPRAMAMTVAIGCSMVFVTPTSHPVNIFVMGLGGYRFRDFVRTGLPMTILLFLTVLVLLPLFWPLG